MSEPNTPRLSVVVPSVNGWSDLRDCLTALDRERRDVALEVLVVERCGPSVREAVSAEFPWATLMPVSSHETIPDMRRQAFRAARGDAVAVIEDHVIVPAGWAALMLAALRTENELARSVVGGSVENAATGNTIDWAAFLCEYSHCLPPLPAGEVAWLTGNNVVYPRALLQEFADALGDGNWENVLHEELRKAGVRLVCRPDIAIGHKKHYSIAEYTSQRYLYARSYAGSRAKDAGLAKRAAYGAGAMLLPPVLFSRVVRRVIASGRHRPELIRSLPLLSVFVTSWALGEVVGAWLGPADSLERVC